MEPGARVFRIHFSCELGTLTQPCSVGGPRFSGDILLKASHLGVCLSFLLFFHHSTDISF